MIYRACFRLTSRLPWFLRKSLLNFLMGYEFLYDFKVTDGVLAGMRDEEPLPMSWLSL